MDKGPKIRIVGGASQEKKEQARKEIEQALFSHFESMSPKEKAEMEALEYPKSEKEFALIDFANQETSRLMQEAGVDSYDIPRGNYHIIPPELYKKAAGDGGNATTFYTKQGILFNAQEFRSNPVHFGAVALHETLHLKSHLSIEVEEENGYVDKTPYREGMSVRALQKHGYHGNYHEHFFGLHEAIVSMQEKKSFARLLDLPILAEEKTWLMSDEAMTLKKELAERKEILEDEIIWIGKKGKNDWETVSYLKPRQVLDYVCVEIQKEFSNQYRSADDVFREFLKSHFTGRLLSVARLTEKTFGAGSFRLLGNMSTDRQSGVLHLESLRKARMRQLKASGR